MNIEERRARRKEIVDEQAVIFAKEEEGEKLSVEEETRWRDLQKEFVEVDAQITRAMEHEGNKESVAIKPDPASADDKPKPTERRSLGQQFVESPQYKALQERGFTGDYKTGVIELRTLFTTDAAVGGDAITPQYVGGLTELLFQRLTVADLLPSGTIDSNLLSYLKETTATNAADTVSEGAAKPESALVLDRLTEPVQKIATFLPVTDEMLEDYSAARSYIDGRLRLFVQQAEEEQLLRGNGTPPDITGILNRSGLQTAQALGSDNPPDAIYKAITKIRANAFLEPDGIVVHPNDWQDIRLGKDDNSQYYAGGPFTGAYGNGGIPTSDSIWGMRVVVTSAMTENTALVGAFRASAQLFRKGGLTVEASNSHSTYFVENKTAIRAEERIALAVYRPGGFGTVTGL